MPTGGSLAGQVAVQPKAKAKMKAKAKAKASVVKSEEPKTADEIRSEMRDLEKYER